jgi:hypothetical protein
VKLVCSFDVAPGGGRLRYATRRFGRRCKRSAGRLLMVLAVGLGQASSFGCGKKGPPLAPLHLVPAPVSDVDVRRSGSDMALRFGLPTTNLNGPGPIELDRVEIYAMTIAPGAPGPANRDLLTRQRVVGSIAVKPPVPEGEGGVTPAAPDSTDTRPSPGERVTFVEELTDAKMTPEPAPRATRGPQPGAGATPEGQPTMQAPVSGAATTQAAQPATTAGQIPAKPAGDPATGQPPTGGATGVPNQPGAPNAQSPIPDPRLASTPSRVYGIRGVTRSGRFGQPVRVTVPLVTPLAPPTGVAARFTESAIALDWTPPPADAGADVPMFNVYPTSGRTAINAAPLATPTYEHTLAEYGKEQCFVVRSVQIVSGVPIESEASAPTCTTPQDIFPPAAPTGLQAVATPDGVSLSWEATAAADLAGYVILRGESPGDTLQPLTPEPIRETTYRDTTVKPGVTYVYAVAAVDRATPPNASPRSEPTTVTAR